MKRWQLRVAGFFLILTPLITFTLLVLKGLPDFAAGRPLSVLGWVYSVTWGPALASGLLLAGSLTGLTKRTNYFHHPYDFGRCFSIGAILGALMEALTTIIYRAVSHRPFSDFWIAGAMIAGCIAGAAISSALLRRVPQPAVTGKRP